MAQDPAKPKIYEESQDTYFKLRHALNRVFENGTIAAAVMVVAAVAAVICANTNLYEPIQEFLEEPVYIGIGGFKFVMTFEAFVNDFLMAIFFLSVGIELKYEMTVGQLRQPKQALLPMMAAVGGVIMPATIYAVINRGGAINGWAIPMATDIAFALGVLSLLGDRVPSGVRVFFSTLAIADDLISIVAIALFYGESPDLMWLLAAAVVTAVLAFLNHKQVFRQWPYLTIGLVLWFCVYQSGIHATLAGVILAFTIPGKSNVRTDNLTEWLSESIPQIDEAYDSAEPVLKQEEFTEEAEHVGRVLHLVTPPLVRLERKINPWVNFIILPIFAFVNAQVRLVGVDLVELVTNPVTLGTYFGMLLGKPIGIVGMTFLLVKTGICELPERVEWKHMIGVGILGGIGFTMSILISGLAFTGTAAADNLLAAKAAILAGSVSAAVIGLVYMSIACKDAPAGEEQPEPDAE